MSDIRKQRLLREALGAAEGDVPSAQGLLLAGILVASLMLFVLVVG